MNTKNLLLLLICLSIWGISCKTDAPLNKHSQAKEKADYVIAHLDDPKIVDQFSEKFFPRVQTEKIVSDMRQNCDWQNKDGKFVDSLSIQKDGANQLVFVYEYFLRCDSIRFLLGYDLNQEQPALFFFQMEPLEGPSRIPVDPNKQLINRR